MPRFIEGLLRLLAGEPWSERRRRKRRSLEERRHSPPDKTAEQERRQAGRRRDDRRGKGWLRFWNPPREIGTGHPFETWASLLPV